MCDLLSLVEVSLAVGDPCVAALPKLPHHFASPPRTANRLFSTSNLIALIDLTRVRELLYVVC